ncbi:damage-inducible protein DinB [Agarivorans sp. B2Z047]|uniref:DinB family protein n=1 Tax=Agarivorans sp. B2Z047 TaxID=2652721 RepID=UPI00128AFFF9|nr:DinB family protein [Agarivorans sp. B2Z047]MPW29902.1 damage-inducible protein DinB [Agarivorans sp. B2Z047]UQN43469.1 DinB family protein [Agarivorans sp. B2Z047]
MSTAFALMAQYNQVMNRQLYACAAQLNEQQLKQDRKAFFGSIFATLNHILVGDTLWLQRFAKHPKGFSSLVDIAALPRPKALNEIIYEDFTSLEQARVAMDMAIIAFAEQLSSEYLQQALSYTNSKGEAQEKPFELLVLHFFNHQTHHRGQVSTLLSQSGIDLGVTDLLLQIPDA